MLNSTSTVLGTNLALTLHDRQKDITPVAGSLLHEMSAAVQNALTLAPFDTNMVPMIIEQASVGVEGNVQRPYVPSSHDSLMDNYIKDISTHLSQHVVFARTVVHKAMKTFEENLQNAIGSYKPRQPEDFFAVKFVKIPEFVNTDLYEKEVQPLETTRVEHLAFNLSTEINATDFDLAAYLVTGDEDLDKIIQSWVADRSKETLIGYLFTPFSDLYKLPLVSMIDYCFVNFLLYRNLNIKKDHTFGLSSVQLEYKTANNRDYFAVELLIAVKLFRSFIGNRYVITPDSRVSFSYMSNDTYPLTIFEENFEKFTQNGGSLETIFGFISSTYSGSDHLTYDIKDLDNTTYVNAWKRTRGLYSVYMEGNRTSIVRATIKQIFPTVFESVDSEDFKTFVTNTPQYKEETFKLVSDYLDNADPECLNNITDLALELVGRIMFRNTDAYKLLKEMYRLSAQDNDIDMTQAALLAALKYVTQFMLSQLTITSVSQ